MTKDERLSQKTSRVEVVGQVKVIRNVGAAGLAG